MPFLNKKTALISGTGELRHHAVFDFLSHDVMMMTMEGTRLKLTQLDKFFRGVLDRDLQ